MYFLSSGVKGLRNPDKAHASPEKGNLDRDFMANLCDGQIYYRCYTNCWPAAMTCWKAREYADDPQSWGKYNVLDNNCETFTTYLKTTKRESTQGSQVSLSLLSSGRRFVTCLT